MKHIVKIENSPSDTVSDLCFYNEYTFGATSWDGSMKIWNIQETWANTVETEYKEPKKSALLRFDFSNDSKNIFFGNTMGEIKSLDRSNNQASVIGHHKGIIVGLKYDKSKNNVITAGSDSVINIWDPRTNKSVTNVKCPIKPTFLDVSGNYAAFSMIESKIGIIDIRNSSNIVEIKSDLPGVITSIALSGDSAFFMAGSSHGCVEISNQNSTIKKVFPCHIDEAKGQAFASNRVKFAMDHKGAFSVGGDGSVAYFDLDNGKKVFEKPSGANGSITAFSPFPKGPFLFVASGYDWSKGISGNQGATAEIHIKGYK